MESLRVKMRVIKTIMLNLKKKRDKRNRTLTYPMKYRLKNSLKTVKSTNDIERRRNKNKIK